LELGKALCEAVDTELREGTKPGEHRPLLPALQDLLDSENFSNLWKLDKALREAVDRSPDTTIP